jgi:Zn-dependent protease with chaperone function
MRSEPGLTTDAKLTDGHTARSVAVKATLTAGAVDISIAQDGAPPTVVARWSYSDLESAVPLEARTTDVLLTNRRAPGATLFVEDTAFAAELARRAAGLRIGAARAAGLRPGAVVGFAAATIAAFVIVLDLSPSKGLARLMPDKARAVLGESVLSSLPAAARTVCTEPQGRQALAALTRRLLPDDPKAAERIDVVAWDLIPNAFAVPGGRVIVTRSLLADARSADELAGVVAHELGHGIELHPEAKLVRSVGFWALVQMLFTGTPGAVGNAGTLLAELAYSRTAEREADDRALALLERAGISAKPFAEFFRRLEGGRPRRNEGGTGPRRSPATSMFSTHPATPERIAKIEAQRPYPATPALDEANWRALKNICATTR